MKKLILGVVAVGLVLAGLVGSQLHKHRQVVDYLDGQGRAAFNQMVLGRADAGGRGLDLGEASAGLLGVYLENPAIILDGPVVGRITARSAELANLEMGGSPAAITRMSLLLSNVEVISPTGQSLGTIETLGLHGLHLADGPDGPALYADKADLRRALLTIPSGELPGPGRLELATALLGPTTLARGGMLHVAKGTVQKLHLDGWRLWGHFGLVADRCDFKSLRHNLSRPWDPAALGMAALETAEVSLESERRSLILSMIKAGFEQKVEGDVESLNMAIEQMRMEPRGEFYPAYTSFWRDLGYDPPVFDAAMDVRWDKAKGDLLCRRLFLASPTLGRLDALADFSGMGQVGPDKPWPDVERGRLERLQLRFEDNSLTNAVLEVVARESGMTLASLRRRLGLGLLVGGLAAGRREHRDAAAALGAFLQDPGTINVIITPRPPLPLGGIDRVGELDSLLNTPFVVEYTPPKRTGEGK